MGLVASKIHCVMWWNCVWINFSVWGERWRRRVVRKGVGRSDRVSSHRRADCHCCVCVGVGGGSVVAMMSLLLVSL